MKLNKNISDIHLSKNQKGYLIIFAFIVLPAAIMAFQTYSQAPQPTAQASQNQNPTTETQQKTQDVEETNYDSAWHKSDFMLRAHDAIRGVLKAPATAEFPGNAEEVQAGVNSKENMYRLDSHVDSENSFGANIRNDFTVVGQKQESGWQLIRVVFDGETVLNQTNRIE